MRRRDLPTPSRRPAVLVTLAAIATGTIVVGAILLAGPGPSSPAAGGGSTVASTLADLDGDGFLEAAPGEQLRDRADLAPASPALGELAMFAQISDAHVRDEESPARAVQLDRFGPPFTEAFRPQEALSAQTLSATVDSANALAPDAVVVTGDLIDSAQENELEAALAVLGGGSVDPDSGARGYDGPQAAASADPFIYRPDVDAPVHGGLLEDAQRPFDSPGLAAPWYPVLGNHEVLVQGVTAPTPEIERIATGGRRLVEVDPRLDLPMTAERAVISQSLADGLPGRTRATPAEPERAYLSGAEVVERLREASGAGGDGRRLDYTFDVGVDLRVIVLDLVRRAGGSGGRIAAPQLDWLSGELARAGARYVVVASHQPLADSAGGERALSLLDREPRVVAAISGHSHRHSIDPRRTAAGGYWLIGTASLADYPQQSRAFRLIETRDGVAVETWVIDHSSAGLAGISRDLSFLDAQGGRPRSLLGSPADRNARLYLERGK